MFESSPSTEKLDAALAKAQGEIEAALKDSTNPHFNKTYADLASFWRACREPLSKHGISLTQWPIHTEDGRAHLMTRVACGGEWMRSTFSMPVDKQNPQGYGSAITYLRRYTMAPAVGIAPDDDDDGNAASKGFTAPPPSRPQAPARPATPPASGTTPIRPAGTTGPNAPNRINPDTHISIGVKKGLEIAKMPYSELEAWSEDAKDHLVGGNQDPETSFLDMARSYRAMRKRMNEIQPSMFENAPSGGIQGEKAEDDVP